MLKGKPCLVLSVTVSKTGKHGHAKCHFTGTDIFTGKKVEDLESSTHNMSMPVVNKLEFDLIDINEDGYMVIMDESGKTQEHLKLDAKGNEKLE